MRSGSAVHRRRRGELFLYLVYPQLARDVARSLDGGPDRPHPGQRPTDRMESQGRAPDATLLKYYLAVTNLSGRTVNVEARYAVLD